jgi:hypothetical protein
MPASGRHCAGLGFNKGEHMTTNNAPQQSLYFLEFQVTTTFHIAIEAATSHEALATARALFASNPSSDEFTSNPGTAHDWVVNAKHSV